ncbi:MAG: hypothetical protein V1827_02025 [Candidatus Micrarchaeota archaeon]
MEIIPKFREIELYAISLSLLLALIISPELVSAYFSEFSSSYKAPAVLGLFALITLYAVPRSIYFAWTSDIPNRLEAMFLVFFALSIMWISAFVSGLIWLGSNRGDVGILEAISGFFVLLGILRAIGIFLMIRVKADKLAEYLDYRNSPRHQVVYMTILILAVALVGRIFYSQPGLFLFLAMVETSRFAEFLPKIELKPRERPQK